MSHVPSNLGRSFTSDWKETWILLTIFIYFVNVHNSIIACRVGNFFKPFSNEWHCEDRACQRHTTCPLEYALGASQRCSILPLRLHGWKLQGVPVYNVAFFVSHFSVLLSLDFIPRIEWFLQPRQPLHFFTKIWGLSDESYKEVWETVVEMCADEQAARPLLQWNANSYLAFCGLWTYHPPF